MAATLDGDVLVNIDIIFGHIELQSRMRREGDRVIGEGRSLHFDRDKKLVKITEWEPTGVYMDLNGYEPPAGYCSEFTHFGAEPTWWSGFMKKLRDWKV